MPMKPAAALALVSGAIARIETFVMGGHCTPSIAGSNVTIIPLLTTFYIHRSTKGTQEVVMKRHVRQRLPLQRSQITQL